MEERNMANLGNVGNKKISSDALKAIAIRAIKVEKRLIGEVAQELGVSRRQIFNWVSSKRPSKKRRDPQKEMIVSSEEVNSMREALKLLKTEVSQLKDELAQYHITESLSDGKIKLSLEKRSELQKAC